MTKTRWVAATFVALTAAMALTGSGVARAQARMQAPPQTFRIQPQALGEDPSRIIPPPSRPGPNVPGSVTLRAGGHDAVMRTLQVVRRVDLPQLRANPRLTLGRTKVDLTPVLTRKGALLNVAQGLQAAPDLGRISVVDLQVSEVPQGLVVRSFLNYQLKSGVCSDARRARVEAIGLHCGRKQTDAARLQAFTTPGDIHYVADPRARAAALAQARAAATVEAADSAKDVANLHAQLQNPVQRKQIEAEIGAPEAQRLSLLSDEDLAGELINSAETKIEQVMFVPKLDAVEMFNIVNLQASAASKPPVKQPPQTVTTNTAVDPAIYLTGFTLGRDYEWQERVETTIKWCVFGCKKTYYAEVHAGFSYGFGLRFPVKLGGNFHYLQDGSGESAQYTASFQPINGSPADYAATGLSSDKIFDGKELVAQVEAHAGFSAHIPIYPDPPAIDISIGKDLTQLLPAPFAGGQFTPPPAHSDSPKAQFIFESIDLLGGRVNFGFAGAQVFPAVEVGLHSDSLTFDLHDDVSNASTKSISNGQLVNLAVSPSHTSGFTISNPVYNLGFVVTPGIDARLFLDIEVWSHNWDFPLWFPALTIELPPGGVNFSCHEGTVCSHSWQFTTIGGATIAGPKGAALGDIQVWEPAFEARWLPQCVDDTCRLGVKLAGTGTVLYVQEQLGGSDPFPLINQHIGAAKSQAESIGGSLVDEAQLRQTAKNATGVSALAEAVWDKQCKDKDCLPDVHAVALQMVSRAKQVQTQHPDYSTFQVLGAISKEFGLQFQAAIDRSQTRATVDGFGQFAEVVWSKQCLDQLCRTNVSLLVGQMLSDARQLQKADPEVSSLGLSGKLGPSYGLKFKKEVDDSKARAAHTANNVGRRTR